MAETPGRIIQFPSGINLVDVRLSAESGCNNGRISSCCKRAIGKTAAVRESGAAFAELEVRCDGYDPQLGCMAEIDGVLFDSQGNEIAYINTSVREIESDPTQLQ